MRTVIYTSTRVNSFDIILTILYNYNIIISSWLVQYPNPRRTVSRQTSSFNFNTNCACCNSSPVSSNYISQITVFSSHEYSSLKFVPYAFCCYISFFQIPQCCTRLENGSSSTFTRSIGHLIINLYHLQEQLTFLHVVRKDRVLKYCLYLDEEPRGVTHQFEHL